MVAHSVHINRDRYLVSLCAIMSVVLGFVFAFSTNYNANRSGYRVEELILLTHGVCYHVHHWMWCTLLVLCVCFGRYVKPDIVVFGCVGFLIGLSLEDLLFKDWYEIRNNCHKGRVIAFMNHTSR